MNEIEVMAVAVLRIRDWHGRIVFDLYYKHSPEMKPIRSFFDQHGMDFQAVIDCGLLAEKMVKS